VSISIPTKITVPFANSAGAYKNTIPIPSQIGITNGIASFTDGFPPLTMTPKASGGVPPYGQDMNGILYNATQALQYTQAGGSFIYDGTFSTAVGGYPIGAKVQATDYSGYWLNKTANNTTSPELFGAGWVPYNQQGETLVTMSSSNITLSALQAAKNIIILSGTISSNLSLILPTYTQEWQIVNNCTGSAYVTVKTASGSGINVSCGNNTVVYGDGTNIKNVAASSALLATNGYQLLPSGLLMQWGSATTPSGGTSVTVTLPIPFTTAGVNISGSAVASPTYNSGMVQFYGLNTTSFIGLTAAGPVQFNWLAIGY